MQSLFMRHRLVPVAIGAGMLVTTATLLVVIGAFDPEQLPRGFASRQQLLGMNLLLVLVPAYMIGAWGLLQRRSWTLLGEVDGLLPGGGFQQRLPTPGWQLLAGGVVGVVYAVVFNLPIRSVAGLVEGGAVLVCLVGLMVLVWLCVGVVLASRLYVSALFLEAGKTVPLDPYDQSGLEPFARTGMGDVLLTVGVLVLTTVQSIDATIRFENYLYALLVAVPASTALLLRPMVSIHARLKTRKAEELSSLNALIKCASKNLDSEAIAALEPLLKRRDRVQELSTWPIRMSMISRLIGYGIIPPVAWTAAAIVEQLVEEALG